jgi:hypothetical protein
MAISTRLSLVQRLASLGLRTTLNATRKDDIYSISRIRQISPTLELLAVGEFRANHVHCIGRVGIPEPGLSFPWKNSMAFYGKWFDRIQQSSLTEQVYRNTARISREKMLEQIQRDDQYAVVGSYYSVFRTVMEAKQHVPLVFIDDSVLTLSSFPVLLPNIPDLDFENTLIQVLCRMIRLYPDVTPIQQNGVSDAHGIEVEEA